MNVDVNDITNKFLDKLADKYNEDTYFVESCHKFPDKYSLSTSIEDLHLQIYFENNNYIILKGERVKYCDKGSKRKIRLYDITNDVCYPELPPVTNYIVDDTWKKIEW